MASAFSAELLRHMPWSVYGSLVMLVSKLEFLDDRRRVVSPLHAHLEVELSCVLILLRSMCCRFKLHITQVQEHTQSRHAHARTNHHGLHQPNRQASALRREAAHSSTLHTVTTRTNTSFSTLARVIDRQTQAQTVFTTRRARPRARRLGPRRSGQRNHASSWMHASTSAGAKMRSPESRCTW